MTRSFEICPRCKCLLRANLVPPVLSLADNETFVCGGCSSDEAFWQHYLKDVPLPPLDEVAAFWAHPDYREPDGGRPWSAPYKIRSQNVG